MLPSYLFSCCKLVYWVFYSSSNIGEFSNDVRLLAALEDTDSDGDKLLGAARRLAGAFSELLNAAQPGTNEVVFVSFNVLILR